MSDLKDVIKESFSQYSGAVLQSRALIDVRDFLKPSARQIFYCLYTDKFLHSKPLKKTLKALGSASRMYIHGDTSCIGVMMRAGQPWAMRYPLIEVKGGIGQPTEAGNWSAPRYTDSRLTELCEYLFKDIDKETIDEWRDNYDDTEKYPAVLTSKGFFNIVNGTSGIGIGMASSIPQFNLKEVNAALVKLLWNPDISFNEIYCVPDFATGAYLLNEEDVKKSLEVGRGASCRLRSVVEFDSKDRCFIVKEIPYGVYTNTICGELNAILEDPNNPGIDSYNDLTKIDVNLKIYLKKTANPDRILQYLFKNTSLQYYYSINMTVLEQGRFPKVYGWKNILQAYLTHQEIVYRRSFEFDLRKVQARLHIVEGILIALAHIEEVVETIKSSSSSATASINLQKRFILDDIQAKAILDMKLSRLAHLEIEKFEQEKKDLLVEIKRIEEILHDGVLLKKEIERDLTYVATHFGDDRRTKILNISQNDEEPTEIKSLLIALTNQNNIFVSEASSLYIQKRGGVGNKFKLNDGEYVLATSNVNTNDDVLFFSQVGNCYHYKAAALPVGEKASVECLFAIAAYEKVCAFTAMTKDNLNNNILIFTKQGMVKKSLMSEYNMTRKVGLKAIGLNEGDEIRSVLFLKDEKVGILTQFGQFLMCGTSDINPIGRVAKGVKAIKLNDNDEVVSVRIIPHNFKEIVSVTGNGYIKRTDKTEFIYANRYTKGSKLHKIADGDYLIDFMPLCDENEIVIVSTRAQIKVTKDSISLLGKGAQGVKSIKLGEKDSVIGISKF